MSAKQEDANLILKLYELRREETLRKARSWFAAFAPESAQDITQELIGAHAAYFRMVISYWDMAASLVNHGAIDEQMFNDANAEHVFIYSKVEPFLPELREMVGVPNLYHHLEELVMRMPDAKERLAGMRERSRRFARMRQEAAQNAQATEQSPAA